MNRRAIALISILALATALVSSPAPHAQQADPILDKIGSDVQALGGSVTVLTPSWKRMYDDLNELLPAYVKAKADLAKASSDLNEANQKNAKLEDDVKKLQTENDKLKGTQAPAQPAMTPVPAPAPAAAPKP